MKDCGLRGLDLLDAAIAHIEAHPETWNQLDWRCETGMCLAGHVAELAGGKWLAPASAPGPVHIYLVPEAGERPTALVLPGGRKVSGVPVADRAVRLLGLPGSSYDMYIVTGNIEDARDLFAALNDLDDIKDIRDALRAEEAAAAGDLS